MTPERGFSFSDCLLNQYRTMTTTQFTLNQGQKDAADDLYRWLMKPDEKHIILSGPGGVGKSYLISYLIDELIPRYHKMCDLVNIPPVYTQVNLTAMSNKAVEVLSESTGMPCSTAHSFLGLIVVNDYSTGATKIKKGKKWQIHSNSIIIIDEYSMEDYRFFQFLNESTLNCKIIHVGDHCQLAAVGDNIPYVSQQNIPRIDLTEQMRNKGQPALQSLCLHLRNQVETMQFSPIDLVPGVVDLLSGEDFQKEIESNFLDPEIQNKYRILAYSNGRVNTYNSFIRDLRQQPRLPVKGEYLICNSAFMPNNVKGFATEEEVHITDISSQVEVLNLPDGGCLEVVYGTLDGQFVTRTNVPIPVDRSHYEALVKHYKRSKDWTTYFKLKDEIPDLRPRDANTIHKSQGSSYDTVYIDLDDLSTCRNPATAARLLYVAASRARNRVVFYGNLPKQLGGLNV